jgi:lysine decarboxylase
MAEQRRPSEQPTAPYLDAVVGYGFREPGRFHVPGHKGGQGADPGLRHAIGDDALLLDVPQDISGIDVGPSPTPYERAELLAAQSY